MKTAVENDLLAHLTQLESAVKTMAAAKPKPDLLKIFGQIDALAQQLPPGTDPTLLHYLHKKSYEKPGSICKIATQKISWGIAAMFDSTSSMCFVVCAIVSGIFLLGAGLIQINWVRPYLERHGQKTGFLLFQSTLLKDYRSAMDLARHQGGKPWFLKAFFIFVVIGILFFLCGLLVTILGEVFGW